MKGLRINHEKRPTRCEICHQADEFDPFTNLCFRCSDIDLPKGNLAHSQPKQPLRLYINFLIVGMIGWSLVGYAILSRTASRNTQTALEAIAYVHANQLDTFRIANRYGRTRSELSELAKFDRSISHCFELPKESEQRWETQTPGYTFFKITADNKANPNDSTYQVILIPKIRLGFFQSGNDCFFVDQTGVVRHSGNSLIIPDKQSEIFGEVRCGQDQNGFPDAYVLRR